MGEGSDKHCRFLASGPGQSRLRAFATSSALAAINVRRALLGKYDVWIDRGRVNTKADAIQHAVWLTEVSVGKILVNSIDRDGMMSGYDVNLISGVNACGDAGSLAHIQKVKKDAGVEAAAAGSLLVFNGRHRAVLINYSSQRELEILLD